MADWKAQYLLALRARDELEQADADIYERCMDDYLLSEVALTVQIPNLRIKMPN